MVGCANVKVKKVSVEKRLSGDECARARLPLLSQPPLHRDRRADLGGDRLLRRPARDAARQDNRDVLVTLAPDPTTGHFRLFDMKGDEIEGTAITQANLLQHLKLVQGPPPIRERNRAAADSGVRLASTTREQARTKTAPGKSADKTKGSLPTNVNVFAGSTKDEKPAESTTTVKAPSETPTRGTRSEVDPLLPDFEEQYAIRNKNFLAKTQYKYTFAHGTELDAMSGSYSAVDVPVKILETVGNLITAAGAVATKGISAAGSRGRTARPRATARPATAS